jgi:hypothetical protein
MAPDDLPKDTMDEFLTAALRAKHIEVPAGFLPHTLRRLREKHLRKAALRHRNMAVTAAAALVACAWLFSLSPAFAAAISCFFNRCCSLTPLASPILSDTIYFLAWMIIALYAIYTLVDSLLID